MSTTLAIELNDAGLVAEAEGMEPLVSPGYALIHGDTLLTGREAVENSRLQPRRINHRFWSELDTTPLGRPFPAGLSHADLAHAHLSALWTQVESGMDAVILAVPGSYTEHQLGLVLGIARACEIPVAGLADAAVVAVAAARRPGRHLLHLDMHLHRVVLTELSHDRELVRRAVRVSDHTGLVALWDIWAKRIARSFVNHTRFDPLHLATAEQTLYGKLPAVLDRLCRESGTVVEMDAAGRQYSIELQRDELLRATAAEYDGILQLVRLVKRAGQNATLLVSHRVAGLPGLREHLAEIGDVEIRLLGPGAATRGALRHLASIRSDAEALPFVTRLPTSEPRPAAAAEGEAEPPRGSGPAHQEQATHLVVDARAFPITDEPFLLGAAIPEGARGQNLRGPTAGISREHCRVFRSGGRVWIEDVSTHGSFLNGQRIDGRAAASAGDVLRVGAPGIEIPLIAVVAEPE